METARDDAELSYIADQRTLEHGESILLRLGHCVVPAALECATELLKARHHVPPAVAGVLDVALQHGDGRPVAVSV